MNIGIYKPGKKVFFNKNEIDHAAWSAEVINLCVLFAQHNNKVFILSETDYNNEIDNIYKDEPDMLDKIFIINGVFSSDTEELELLAKLKMYTDDINFICSDMRLITKNETEYKQIFTQSMRWHTYGAIQEHQAINHIHTNIDLADKHITYYFGGTERGRSKDFFEYIIRPNCEWYGKSETLKFTNYIPHDEHIEKLKQAKSTIIIADEKYNETGFVNDRYYECSKYDVVCFMDSKVDPDELIMSKSDWCRVSSYAELQQKQKEIKANDALYNEIIEKQRNLLNNKRDGENIYHALISNERYN